MELVYMKTKEDIIKAVNELKINIWGNPKRPDDVQMDCCEYCGKKCGKNPYRVHVDIHGTIIPNTISEEELEFAGFNSQGTWVLGNGCAKKLLGKNLEKYILK